MPRIQEFCLGLHDADDHGTIAPTFYDRYASRILVATIKVLSTTAHRLFAMSLFKPPFCNSKHAQRKETLIEHPKLKWSSRVRFLNSPHCKSIYCVSVSFSIILSW